MVLTSNAKDKYTQIIHNILTFFNKAVMFKGRSDYLNREERQKSFLKVDALVKKRGITIYKLAKDLGLAPTVFSDWKTGKSKPKLDKLMKIAEYFGVSVEYFAN